MILTAMLNGVPSMAILSTARYPSYLTAYLKALIRSTFGAAAWNGHFTRSASRSHDDCCSCRSAAILPQRPKRPVSHSWAT